MDENLIHVNQLTLERGWNVKQRNYGVVLEGNNLAGFHGHTGTGF